MKALRGIPPSALGFVIPPGPQRAELYLKADLLWARPAAMLTVTTDFLEIAAYDAIACP